MTTPLTDIQPISGVTGYYASRNIISSDDYLNDPIEFTVSGELIPPNLTTRIDGLANQYTRDVSKFVKVELDPDGNFNLQYVVPLETHLYSRERYFELFDTEFTELI